MYDVEVTEEFRSWLKSLRDLRARTRIVSRLRVAGSGNLGEWKPVSGVVSEMRIDAGAGYRLYFMRRGRTLIVVLAGGDKSSQKRDIARAIHLATKLELDL